MSDSTSLTQVDSHGERYRSGKFRLHGVLGIFARFFISFLLSKIDSAHIFSSMQQRDGDTAVSFQNVAAARLTDSAVVGSARRSDTLSVQHLADAVRPQC